MSETTNTDDDMLAQIPHADTVFTDKSREEIEGTEFVGEMGNAYVIKHPNGNVDWISKQSEVILLYEHGLYNLIQGGSGTNPIVLSEADPFVAIAPTSSKLVYTLWVDDKRPVQNQPNMCETLLQGVIDAIENDDYSTLENVYTSIISDQVNVEVINDILSQHEPIPRASVVPMEEGWVIEGIFLVTWEGSIYLRTQERSENYFYEMGGYNADSSPEVLTLYPELPEQEVEVPLIRPESADSDTPTEEELEQAQNRMMGMTPVQGVHDVDMEDVEMVSLDENDLQFLIKALWLVNYRENYDDDLFWDVIEQHVQRGLQQSAANA